MSDSLPNGYAYFRVGKHALLVVPHAVAVEAEAALELARQRKVDEQLAQRQAEDAQGPAQTIDATPAPPLTPGRAEQAAPGFHRVLPRYAELEDARANKDLNSKTSDIEVRLRLDQIQRQLLQRGPDRMIARPANWPAAMDELEQALPNFRAPIELLRDTLALADAASTSVRIPPMLLLGPPGVGKTYFSHRVAELLGAPHASIAFDQPSAGSQLRGSDKFWSNTETGLLFNLICLGEAANPVILLDELDKSCLGSNRREIDPLSQLHGVLEPQTARCITDISVDIEFDASLVTYIATANSIQGMGSPLVSRFEVFDIGPPDARDAVQVAGQVIQAVLQRLGLQDRMGFDRRCAYVLARLSPRRMHRMAERLIAAALRDQRTEVTESDVWAALALDPDGPRLH
ncbi:AAA family ATPase [Roseateles toxinivorans]|uniref:ATP-dependent Lon protease n=1 Tax=Roseateles toxinivorans TaxID=270368 RepID=A0A4R6QE03_9BURK|nr:AAA family ATPase [Roseateles toxinivorans]TDP60447.1 ATP-dependent Lon protease [Roseateles toxinivorans]